MDANLKKILRSLSLELRHVLEGRHDDHDAWHPGDLERRLNELGVWRDRAKDFEEVKDRLTPADRAARKVVDAYLDLRKEAGVGRAEAVAEFVRETAYTWANRLLAVRCMEARGIIDEVILQKDAYGGRSLVHSRFARKNPEVCAGEDDGLFDVLTQEFAARARELPGVFDPAAPAVALRPSVAALKLTVALLSGRRALSGQEAASDAVFEAPDALGWAYQYWNAEEKDRVFAKVRTQRAKIEGADIIPATQLYTEPYMVKFLVQNSLGATWMGMNPGSRLANGWEYYVRDADRALVTRKPVAEITFLDPAVGSGHFLLEAFDLFWGMYEEEGIQREPEAVAAAILNNNLFGIDIDERAVQIAQAALWMKAKERAPNLSAEAVAGFRDHLVATNIRLPRGEDHVRAFLDKHPEDAPLRCALPAIFEGLANVHELGSLLKVEEIVEDELAAMRRSDPLFAHSIAAEGWKGRVLTRLKEHFAAEARAADLAQAFFSQSAGRGLALFDLLARRYDVVTANPPYMGSKNMGPVVKRYLERHYGPGKRDLYAAFILRCLDLTGEGGRVAMVTQQSWMFLKSFADLRANERTSGVFAGLLRETTFETLAHLGARAFNEISGEVVNVALVVVVREKPSADHRLISFRLTSLDDASSKAEHLHNQSIRHKYKYTTNQFQLLSVERAPVMYWLSSSIVSLFENNEKLSDACYVRQGICTTNNNRFLRSCWESPLQKTAGRWFLFAKGGGTRRWSGYNRFVVDWQFEGIRVKTYQEDTPGAIHWSGRMPESRYFFQQGWTFSRVASGTLSLREILPKQLFCDTSPAVIPYNQNDCQSLAFYLNTRISTYLLRALTQSLDCREGYVQRLPLIKIGQCSESEKANYISIRYSRWIDSQDLTEWFFDSSSILSSSQEDLRLRIECYYAISESYREKTVANQMELSDSDLESIVGDLGTPAGWFPLISGYENPPMAPGGLPPVTLDGLSDQPRRNLTPTELAGLKRRLRFLYTAGFGATSEADEADEMKAEEDDLEDISAVGARIPIPAETFVEELASKLEVHPISIYSLLKEGRETEGWRCPPEEKRLLEDRLTVLILRLLGHRWPRQVEAGEAVPDWADRDGVIPLTAGCGETTLADRVEERLAAELPGATVTSVKREFTEAVGQSLDDWLAGPFFARHISQFRKRPIAWQIQSRPQVATGGGRRRRGAPQARPAFACLVYYHKLDADLLAKLRTHYVGPLRTRCETELRTLEAVASRTDDQDARKVYLANAIDELRDFDAKLAQVADQGFAFPKLADLIGDEPLDPWTSRDGVEPPPADRDAFLAQEGRYDPDLNDGVRVNVAPLQAAGLLAADVIAPRDLVKAIADRATWRADERRWCREGKLPRPGWWKAEGAG